MKKLILTFLAIFVVVVFSDAQTLDEVLTKHFKAVGQEKLVDVKTFVMQAKVSQMGMELPMEMKIKRKKCLIKLYSFLLTHLT